MRSQALLQWLVLATLASSLMVLIALALRARLRRAFGASAAYWLWFGVPASVLATLLPGAPAITAAAPRLLPVVVASVAQAPQAALGSAPGLWLVAVWLLGAIVACALLARQQWRLQHGLRPRPATAGEAPAFRDRGGTFGPALVGLLRPRIVLPDDFETRYDAAERRLILSHERMHQRRGDALANAVAAALRALFWFSPLIHFAARRHGLDQELACDADVLRSECASARTYAQAMMKTQLTDIGLPVGCHWQSSQPLKERITMLKQKQATAIRRRLGMGVAAAIAATFALATYAAQPGGAAATHVPATAAANDVEVSYASMSPPGYPKTSIAAKEEGIVVLELLIARDGSVIEAQVYEPESVKSQALRDSAIAAVKTWRFNAARRAGQPIESRVRVPLTFSLEPDAGAPYQGKGALDTVNVSATR